MQKFDFCSDMTLYKCSLFQVGQRKDSIIFCTAESQIKRLRLLVFTIKSLLIQDLCSRRNSLLVLLLPS